MANAAKQLCSLARKKAGRKESLSMGIIDSRNVKSSHPVDSDRGIDGNKTVKGRKEHIVVENAVVLRWI